MKDILKQSISPLKINCKNFFKISSLDTKSRYRGYQVLPVGLCNGQGLPSLVSYGIVLAGRTAAHGADGHVCHPFLMQPSEDGVDRAFVYIREGSIYKLQDLIAIPLLGHDQMEDAHLNYTLFHLGIHMAVPLLRKVLTNIKVRRVKKAPAR